MLCDPQVQLANAITERDEVPMLLRAVGTVLMVCTAQMKQELSEATSRIRKLEVTPRWWCCCDGQLKL